MHNCNCEKDIMRIHLDSESALTQDQSIGKYTFNIKLPVKRNTYKSFVLYVDDFDIQTEGLGNSAYILNSDIIEYNSYNSRTGGNNTTLASMFANAKNTGRTSDFALNYQAPTKPIIINNIPENLTLQITDIDNVGIDFSDAANFWLLDLRIEAYY